MVKRNAGDAEDPRRETLLVEGADGGHQVGTEGEIAYSEKESSSDGARVRGADLEGSEEERRDALVLLQNSIEFSDQELHTARKKAWRYYNGHVDHNAAPGRSKVVKPEVRDAVEMLMPPIMSTLLSGENMVEFVGTDAQSLIPAGEATIEINNIFFDDNRGWEILHDAIKDSMVTRTAMLKVCDEEYEEEESYEAEDPIAEEVATSEGFLPPAIQSSLLTRTVTKTRHLVYCIPPEEILMDRYCRNSNEYQLLGTRRMITFGELHSMGFDKETLVRVTQAVPQELEGEEQERTGFSSASVDRAAASAGSKSIQSVMLHEYLVRVGSPVRTYHVFSTETSIIRFTEVNDNYNAPDFIPFSSIRIPHTAIGRSPTDQVIPLQDIGTVIFRQTLDNLYWSNTPALQAVKNSVNPYQLQNWKFGTVFDVKMTDAIKPLTIPFVADKNIIFFDWLEKQREQRTGGYKDALGLNPQMMQNQSATVGMGIMTAAQRQIEMYVRVIAETAITRVYRSLFKRRFGTKLPFKIRVKVGLGFANREDKIQQLMLIASKQEASLQLFGIKSELNPVCTVDQYVNTLREIIKLTQFYDPNIFFKTTEKVEETLQLLSQQPPQPSEAEMKMQVEQKKAELDMQVKQAELQLKQQDQQVSQQMDQAKVQMDMQVQQAEMRQAIELERAKMMHDMQLKQAQLEQDLALSREKQMHEMELAQQKADLEMQLRQQEAIFEARLEVFKMKNETRDGQGNIPRGKD